MASFCTGQDYLDFTSEQAYGLKDSAQYGKSHKFFKVLQKLTVNPEKKNEYILERVKGQIVSCPIEQNAILRRGIKYNNYSELNFEYIAQNYKQQKKLRLAMRYLDIGLSLYPQSHQLLLEKGSLLLEMRKYDEAINHLQQGLSLIEKNQELSDRIVEQKFVGLYNLGLTFEEDDCLEIALSYYEQCLQIDDQDYDVLYSMVGIYSDLGQHHYALDLLNTIIEQNPVEIKAFIEMGRIFIYLQDQDSMQRQMNNLLEINEGNYEEQSLVYIQWSELLLSCDMVKEALDKSYLAQKVDAKNQQCLVAQAKCLSFLGRHEDALNTLNLYYQTHISDHNALALIGIEYLLLDQFDKSIDTIQSAINISNDHEPSYHYSLAKAFYAHNKYQNSVNHLLINIERSSGQLIQSLILLANSYAHLHQNQKAIETYEQILQVIGRKTNLRLKKCISLHEFNNHLKFNQDKYYLKSHEEISHYIQKRIVHLKNISKNE